MKLDSEAGELAEIARAFRTISKEISYGGLANALLDAALTYSGTARGAVLLSEGGELLVKADAKFHREGAKISAARPNCPLHLPPDLTERVLVRQETIIGQRDRHDSPLTGQDEEGLEQGLAFLCMPLIHQERTIGVLYLEAAHDAQKFTPRCVSAISMLASQAAVAFESAQLFEALRETNMWMIRAQQLGRMGCYRWNTRTLLSRGSREVYRILGLDLNINPVPFEAFRDRVHPDDLPGLERALAHAVDTQSAFSHEYRAVHKDGTTLQVVAVGQFDYSPSGDLELEGIIADVTERKAVEQAFTDTRAELARAARLASLGELAGSIVHEINQPLTSVLASAEACLRWLTREPAELCEARRSVCRVIDQAKRASSVVKGLRSLVRDGQLHLAEVEINEAVEEILVISKTEFDRGAVTLRTDLDRSMPRLKADRVQLQQVVFNLVRNAVDAMAEVRGRPRVLTVSSTIDDGCAAVSIADTGIGLDVANKDRLFDPLYTTKGQGLGLGLSICRKIVAAHGGRLWAEQNTPHGATFGFALPLGDAAPLSGSD